MAGPKTPAKQAPATPKTAGASKRANAPTVAPTSSTSSSSSPASSGSKLALDTLWAAYLNTTPSRLKLIDAFLVFLILSGVSQFVYCVLVTSFPFNAFLAGFASTVGQFVLTASLRSQVNVANRALFKEVSPERAFADFVVGSVVLHFFVFNFLG